LLGEIRKEGFDILMSPETTGKASVFGSLDEILKLAEEISGLNLCVDFAHLYSRSLGKLNSYEDFCEVLERIRRINPALLDALHIHISGIQYGEKGEVRHLPLGESGFDYRACLDALIDYGVKGVAVCESPALERDALILKEYYENRKAGEY
jgi:deoxyribonuclease-4